MKRLLSFILVFAILLVPALSFAEAGESPTPDLTESASPLPEESTGETAGESAPESQTAGTPVFENTCGQVSGAMLIDPQTGTVLYEHNADERVYPASTTKLMTSLLLVELADLDEQVTVGSEVNFNSTSSLMGLKSGDTVTVRDLLYGLIVCSGNDAAAAIAVHISGTIEGFAQLMNERAQQLGMTNTQFINPHGLYESLENDPERGSRHYTTTRDMSLLSLECMKHPEIMEAAATDVYQVWDDREPLYNSNCLLYVKPNMMEKYGQYIYEGTTGLKTGLNTNLRINGQTVTNGALVATATRDGSSLLACVFGDYSEGAMQRWELARSMLDYGFNNFQAVDISPYVQPVTEQQQLTNYAANDALGGVVGLVSQVDGSLSENNMRLLSKAAAEGLQNGTMTVETNVTLTKPPVAPITEGEEMGLISYEVNGETLYSCTVKADRNVYQTGEEELAELQSEEVQQAGGTTASTFPTDGDGAPWYYWLLIPVAVVALLFIIRAVNKARMRARRKRRASMKRQERAFSEFGQRSTVSKSADIRPSRRR